MRLPLENDGRFSGAHHYALASRKCDMIAEVCVGHRVRVHPRAVMYDGLISTRDGVPQLLSSRSSPPLPGWVEMPQVAIAHWKVQAAICHDARAGSRQNRAIGSRCLGAHTFHAVAGARARFRYCRPIARLNQCHNVDGVLRLPLLPGAYSGGIVVLTAHVFLGNL